MAVSTGYPPEPVIGRPFGRPGGGYDALGAWRGQAHSLNLPCLFRQHDRNAVADRVGEFCGTRDQFVPRCVKLQRTLGHRTPQDFQQFGIDGAFEAFGRGGHALVSAFYIMSVAYSMQRCSRALIARRSGAARRAPPAVSPAAMVVPTGQNRQTPSREFARGRGPRQAKAPKPAGDFRYTPAGGGRSPAPRREPGGRAWPSCAPPSPAPACRRTPGAAAAKADFRDRRPPRDWR